MEPTTNTPGMRKALKKLIAGLLFTVVTPPPVSVATPSLLQSEETLVLCNSGSVSSLLPSVKGNDDNAKKERKMEEVTCE